MAQPNRNQAPPVDLPPAFDDAHADDSENPRLSQGQITGKTFDTGRRQERHKEMTAPPGDYTKSTRWDTFEIRWREDDSQPGDTYPQGRVTYSISGKADKKTVNGIEYEPLLFIRLSPDERHHQNPSFKGEMDFQYKMYDRVCEAFLAIHGRELKNEDDLKLFLEEGEYTLNTMLGSDDRLGVMHIKKTMKPGERRYPRRA